MKKRWIALALAVTLLFTGGIGRVGYIIFSHTYTVSDSYNSYAVTIDSFAPTLYDRNGERLTNNAVQYAALLRPNSETLGELYKLFERKEEKEIIEELKRGYPIVRSIPESKKDKTRYIRIFETTATENFCPQLLSKSSSGLLKYLPLTAGKRKVNFTIDAKGRILSGDNGTVEDENYTSSEGLQLSLDRDIQKITYDACSKMEQGCAIVMNVADASLLACVTKPDASYMNKPFQKYAVGSVFKIVIAACAIENKMDLLYNCTGTITVGDTTYSCQNHHIHSYQTLKTALAHSCNCYFVNLAVSLGAEKITETMKEFGFDDVTKLYGDWEIDNASLPTEEELTSKGELALLGFGQGKLTATPLQICAALCTIANQGKREDTRLVLSSVNQDGDPTDVTYPKEERIMSASAAQALLDDLRYVVTNGTGYNAETSAHQSAGKTATAQTGQFEDGKERLNTWFAGVYPYEKPQYAIVIMTENGTSGAEDCCPIFSTIVEKLEDL